MNYADITIISKISLRFPTFIYKIPINLRSLKEGDSVLVSFKKKEINGIVIKIHNNKPDFGTKDILKKTEKIILHYQYNLAKFISNYYFCPLFDALKLFIPEKILKNNTKQIEKSITSNRCNDTLKQIKTLDIKQNKRIIEIINKKKPLILFNASFLQKIQTYLEISNINFKNNKQTLILIPELLSAQPILEEFKKIYSDEVIFFHNKLTANEKLQHYFNIKSGKTKIVIGTKLALFLPFSNLKTIIVDREHERAYKNEKHPKFDARTLVIKLQKELNLNVIFETSSPRIETYFKALQKEYIILKTSKEIEKPKISIVDLKDEFKKNNFSIFSEILLSKIKFYLSEKKQIVLILNRLGSGSITICKDCGYIEKCKNCDLNLRYNGKTKILYCPYCSFKKEVPLKCPNCESAIIKIKGIGTQKAEEELKKIYPSANIFRADRESLTKKTSASELYKKIKNKKIDILIGTQIAAGIFNLPNIKLVSNLLLDLGFNIPDFRSQEYAFQTVGNLINTNSSSEILIQTFNRDNEVLTSSLNGNYHKFALNELNVRKDLSLPPFSKQIKISCQADSITKSENSALSLSQSIIKFLHSQNFKKTDYTITNFPARVFKMNKNYIWNILITEKKGNLDLTKFEFPKNIKIDVDPIITG